MQSFTKKFAAKKQNKTKQNKTKRRSAKLLWRKHVSGFYQSTFIYSRFSPNCLASSLSPWGIPMIYIAEKFFEIQNARKCISECTSIGWTWLTTVFFLREYQLRLPPFCHFTFLSAAAAIFVGILECYGEFRRNVNNKDTHNLPLCVFVTI